MEQLSREELDRLMFFEQAREQAEQDYARNKNDNKVLTRWGGTLLELAHFRQGADAYDMIDQAVSKFQQALKIDGQAHETLWCLGNAYTSQGFLTADTDQALSFFKQARGAFEKALKEDPSSDVYKKAVEMTAKAPQLHAELQKQLAAAQVGGREAGTSKSSSNTEFWYDVAGWGLLVAIGVAWVALAKTNAAAPPLAK